MERWGSGKDSVIDGLLLGLFTGLAICLVASSVMVVLDTNAYKKEVTEIQREIDESKEQRRLELEGYYE